MSSPSDQREHAPRQSPVGLLTSFVLLVGCALVVLGIIWLDHSTATGELLILIGVIAAVIGLVGLGLYMRSVRPGRPD